MFKVSLTRCLLQNFQKSTKVRSKNFFRNFSSVEPYVVRSKVPDIAIPDISLSDYVWKNLEKWPQKTALVCAETGRSYTYEEFYKKTQALANFLYKFKGLGRHDTVAVVLPNVPEFPIILLAAIEAGLKVTTINPIYTAEEIARQLQNSQTKLIFALNELWPNIQQATQKTNQKIPVVTINQKDQQVPSGAIKFNEICDQKQTDPLPPRSFDETIILPYSSGTTGHPKGVELTMRNIVSVLHQIGVPEFKIHRETQDGHQDSIPVVLPMFHIYGMVTLTFNLLSAGCKLITVPKFSPQIFAEVLETHQPDIAFLVPPIVLMLAADSKISTEKHLSRLRAVLSGGAPLGETDIQRFHEKTKKVTLLQGYGLTETSPSTHQQTELMKNGIKLGGCGFSVPNTECKIVSTDGQGTALGPNESGELLIRGPQVMKGYFNNPEATQNVLDNLGWFKTGDIAHYDQDGHFFITDRLKELIKVKGFQVAPAELEEILRDHGEIEDAAVIGVPHRESGEVPKAFIVLKNGARVDGSKIQEYVAGKVAKYKQLAGGVVFLEAIPKSASGKILRRELKNY